MRVQPAVREETRKIALGIAALTAAMLLVFLLLDGGLQMPVLLGALLGYAVAVGNFFLMALSVQQAAGKMNGTAPQTEETDGEQPEEAQNAPLSPEAKQARQGMRFSYIARMLLMALTVIMAVKLPCFSPFAAILPLFFPRIVIAFEGLWMKKKDKQA